MNKNQAWGVGWRNSRASINLRLSSRAPTVTLESEIRHCSPLSWREISNSQRTSRQWRQIYYSKKLLMSRVATDHQAQQLDVDPLHGNSRYHPTPNFASIITNLWQKLKNADRCRTVLHVNRIKTRRPFIRGGTPTSLQFQPPFTFSV